MRYGATLLMALFLWGCAGTDVGNPKSRTIVVDFVGFDEQLPNALTLASGLRIDEVWMSFASLRLRDGENCADEGDLYLHGPFVVELLSGREFPTIQIESKLQSLCRLSLDFALYSQDHADFPAALRDHSILIRGHDTNGQPFELQLARSEVTHLLSDSGSLRLLPDEDHLLVGFPLNEWFGSPSFDLARFNSEQEKQNAATAQLWNDIRRSVKLYRDDNRDGLLQPDESKKPLAGGEL